MTGRLRTGWARVQETPFEVAICALAAAQAVLALVAEWHHLSVLTIVLYLFIGVGGLATCAGRLRLGVAVESAGIALIVGAYAAVVWLQVIHLRQWEQLANSVLSAIALLLAFGIRLYVLRRSIGIRRREPR